MGVFFLRFSLSTASVVLLLVMWTERKAVLQNINYAFIRTDDSTSLVGKKKKKKLKRPFRMFLFPLSYIGSFIDRCLSLYYHLYLQAGYYCECKVLCSSTFNSNLTPYESTGLWTATEWYFEIRSWKCLTWKGELESLALWTFSFQSPTESTGRTITDSLGALWAERGCVVMRF